MVFAEALWKAVLGGYGQHFRTTYREFPLGFRRSALTQELSGFKASLRKYPAHGLAGRLHEVRTRILWEGQMAVIESWKDYRPTTGLQGVINDDE